MRIFRWIVVAVVVLLVATGGYVWYNSQHFTSGITHVDAITHSNAPAKDLDGKDQNIVLVGDDHRPAGATAQELAQLGTTADGGGTNTDTMMVLHVPADGRKATLISLPRDSWVDIPGFGMNKLNAAFAFGSQNGGGDAGGARLLISTIQNLTGLTIDHFVRISMLGFYNVVNALGPVDVCLNNAVNDPYSTVNLPKGISTLNAQQALAFVRQRHGLTNGDLDRVARQQYFLSVEARQVLSAGTLLNPVKLQNVLDAVSSSIQTDPGLDLIALATQLHGLGANSLSTATIPVSGTPTITVNGSDVSIVQVDSAAMPAFINSVIANPTAFDKATAAAPSAVTVTVLNGSSTNGAAASNTATLAALGFKTGTPGSTSTTATTTVEYPPGMESAAKAVAAHVPGAAASSTTSVNGVTLVLGTDGLQVTSTSASSSSASGPSPAPTPSGPTKTYAQGACIN